MKQEGGYVGFGGAHLLDLTPWLPAYDHVLECDETAKTTYAGKHRWSER